MSDADWTCDSCTFINSGLLPTCEVCGASRVGAGPDASAQQAQHAEDETIVLSEDGISDDDVIALGDVRQVAGARRSQGAGPGPSSAAANCATNNRSTRSSRQPAADVTIIDDDDDNGPEAAVVDLTAVFPTPWPRRTGRVAAGSCVPRPTGGRGHVAAGPADELYTLDACNCAVTLQSLAARLRPAVGAALGDTTNGAAPPADGVTRGQRPAVGLGCAAAAGDAAKAAGPSVTLLDLAAPLLCPALACDRWLSSRDVRLLLGPLRTKILYHALCEALRREGKATKAALAFREGRDETAIRGAGTSAPVSAQVRDGHGDGTGTAHASSAGRPAGSNTAGTGVTAVRPDEVTPLLPLAPSCPTCRARMLPTCQLTQMMQQQRQQQGQQRQAQHAPPQAHLAPVPPQQQQGSWRSRRRQTSRSRAHYAAGEHDAPPSGPNRGNGGGAGGGVGDSSAAMVAKLRAALAARGRPAASPDASLERLCSDLREVVGPSCVYICLGCAKDLAEQDVLPRARREELQAVSNQAFRALKLLRRVRAVLLSAQEDGDEGEDGDEAANGGGGAAAAAAGGRGSHASPPGGGRGRSGRKRRRSGYGRGGFGGGGTKAWAKGVGYGGSGGDWGRPSQHGGGPSNRDLAALQAAQDRQRQADDEVRSCLTGLLEAINPANKPALASPPPLLHAVLHYGGLPYILRLLLQNDSLLDMGQRQGLYRAVLAIVRCCISSMSLLELMVVPASDPRDTAPPGAALMAGAGAGTLGASGSGAGGANSSDPPVCAVFESLGRQCAIFKRSAQELADGAEEDIAALGLALELGALAEEVAGGVSMWRSNMEEAQGTLHNFLKLPSETDCGGGEGGAGASSHRAAAAGGGAAGNAAHADAPPAKRNRHGGSAEAATAAGAAVGSGDGEAADAAALATRRSEYTSVMRPLQFREVPLMEDHYFRREVGAAGSSAGGEVMRQRLKRITGEISGLATGLPLDWEASAFVAVDDNRVDVLRALLIPASDTPYANGPFIFDIYLPPEYPNKPPKVQFLTTGGGKIRFNPNLYAEGKVCLSLLGTWSGPSWDPAMSTILQVLVSIQSMILVTDPYYNEPGWEAQAGSAAGRQAASDYSNTQRYNTMAFSILPALQMLTSSNSKSSSLSGGSTFRDVLTQHFRLKRPELLRQFDEWLASITASAAQSRQPQAGRWISGWMPDNMEKVRQYTEQLMPQLKSLLGKL